MSVRDLAVATLRQQAPQLDEPTLQSLADQIERQVAEREELSGLPDEVVRGALLPTLQIMLAQDHGTIEHAAQYAIQVLVTQVGEDPHSIIPKQLRDPSLCPYPGLQAYSEADASYFYGRSREVDEFLTRMDQRLLAVTGPSGVGKSSFVLAGVIPGIRSRFGESAALLSFRLTTSPNLLGQFAVSLGQAAGVPVEALLQQLDQRDDALIEVLRTLAATQQRTRVVLVLDQFEALFVGDDPARTRERQRLLANVVAVQAQPDSLLTIILTSRENYFEHPDYTRLPAIVAAVQEHNIRLDALDDDQLREAIEQPLVQFNTRHKQNLSFQLGLVDLIVSGFRQPAVSLPIVQYLLRLLWVEKQHLTHYAYNSLGGLDRVLDRHATEIYMGFSEDQRQLLNAILIALVRPGVAGEYTRKRVRRDDLFAASDTERRRAQRSQILERLSDPRSRIISEQQIGGETYLELTHEILLRQWMLLQGLTATHQARIEERERLLPTAELWLLSRSAARPNGDPSYLYRGESLARVQRYLSDPFGQDDVQGALIACFEASRAYRRQLGLRLTLGSLALFAVIGIIIMWLQSQAETARRDAAANATAQARAEAQANTNATAQAQAQAQASANATAQALAEQRASDEERLKTSQRLASDSQRQLSSAPETALVLAYEAAALDHSPATEQALRDALEQLPFSRRALSTNASGMRPALSPDGTRLLVSAERETQIWDLQGQHIATLAGSSGQWSPDGQRVATRRADGTIVLQTLSGEQLGAYPAEEYAELTIGVEGRYLLIEGIDSAGVWDGAGKQILTFDAACSALSPAEDRLVVAVDSTLELWDLDSGDVTRAVGLGSCAIEFSRDGSRVLSSGLNGTWLWDLSAGRWQLGDSSEAQFSQDGKYVITQAGSDGVVRVWDLQGVPVAAFPGETGALSPNNQLAMTISSDNVATVWSFDGTEVGTLEQDVYVEVNAQFSPAGDTLLTWSEAGALAESPRLWDTNGFLIATLPGRGAAFSPDGHWILTWARTGESWLSNSAGRTVMQFPGEWAEFTPDGEYVYSWSDGGRVQLWDTRDSDGPYPIGAQPVEQVVIGDGGNLIATETADDRTLLWDSAWRQLAQIDGGQVQISPDARTIVTSSGSGAIWIWGRDGRRIAELDASAAVLSPRGDRIVTYARATDPSRDAPTRLWSSDGRLLAELVGREASFSADGLRIMTTVSSSTTTRTFLWDGDGRRLEELPLSGLGLSADGQHILAICEGGETCLFSVAQPDVVLARGRAAIFSPDSSTALFALDGGQLLLWEARDGRTLPLAGHADNSTIDGMAFSADGSTILTTAYEATLVGARNPEAILWSRAGVELQRFGAALQAEFSADGTRVIAIYADGDARVWSLQGDQLTIMRGVSSDQRRATYLFFAEDGRRMFSLGSSLHQHLFDIDEMLAVAACRVQRGPTDVEIARFSIPTPPQYGRVAHACAP